MRKEISPQEQLLESLFIKPSGIIEVESRLVEAGKAGINIGSLEGAMLETICSQNHVEKIVEIGTQFGCSAVWMARGLKSRGIIYTCEKDPECIAAARETFAQSSFQELGCEVRLLEGEAKGSLKSIEEKGPFDLVFIDANKSGYFDYYQWAREFLKPGGYLIADNVFLFGTMFCDEPPTGTPVKMWNVMRKFLQEIFKDPLFTSSLIPTQEGLVIAVKN